MRNQPLTGYVLHQKPYGETRSLIYFFSQEFGIIHGLGKKNLPLFVPIQVMANGKNALKTFSQSQVLSFESTPNGQGLFAGMYLNEILLKLLPIEEPMSELWQAYQDCVTNIHQIFASTSPHQMSYLKFQLRQFETLLFEQLGYGLDFSADAQGENIELTQSYRYQLQQGFVPILPLDKFEWVLTGEELQRWQQCLQDNKFFDKILNEQEQATLKLLNTMGGIYRNILDNLLNYQKLESRELWRQLNQYS